MLTACISGEVSVDSPITDFVNPIIHVIESAPIHDLLVKMQKERVHMAILSDEYGGTAGLSPLKTLLKKSSEKSVMNLISMKSMKSANSATAITCLTARS